MPRSQNNPSAIIVEALNNLIALTKGAKLDFATQLLQMAHLDILMNQHGVSPDELDALRVAMERRTGTAKVANLEQIRLSRRKRASGD